MARVPRQSFMGEVVRIRETDELAIVISDNLYLESESTKWRAVVRTLNGDENIYFLSQLDMEVTKYESGAFIFAVRMEFSDLDL